MQVFVGRSDTMQVFVGRCLQVRQGACCNARRLKMSLREKMDVGP